jgi:hypothetical protein
MADAEELRYDGETAPRRPARICRVRLSRSWGAYEVLRQPRDVVADVPSIVQHTSHAVSSLPGQIVALGRRLSEEPLDINAMVKRYTYTYPGCRHDTSLAAAKMYCECIPMPNA